MEGGFWNFVWQHRQWVIRLVSVIIAAIGGRELNISAESAPEGAMLAPGDAPEVLSWFVGAALTFASSFWFRPESQKSISATAGHLVDAADKADGEGNQLVNILDDAALQILQKTRKDDESQGLIAQLAVIGAKKRFPGVALKPVPEPVKGGEVAK